MNNYYILRKGEYYLSDVMVEDGILTNFTVDKDFRRLYADIELALDDQKLIFIETGLNFNVEKFKEVKNEN